MSQVLMEKGSYIIADSVKESLLAVVQVEVVMNRYTKKDMDSIKNERFYVYPNGNGLLCLDMFGKQAKINVPKSKWKII